MRLVLSLASGLALFACIPLDSDQSASTGNGEKKSGYRVENLASDTEELAPHVDPDLVNSWGIARGPGGFWIANNETGKIAIYSGAGVRDEHSGQLNLGAGITGIVANSSTGFQMCSGSHCAPAQFI